jgi:hypothetical protein
VRQTVRQCDRPRVDGTSARAVHKDGVRGHTRVRRPRNASERPKLSDRALDARGPGVPSLSSSRSPRVESASPSRLRDTRVHAAVHARRTSRTLQRAIVDGVVQTIERSPNFLRDFVACPELGDRLRGPSAAAGGARVKGAAGRLRGQARTARAPLGQPAIGNPVSRATARGRRESCLSCAPRSEGRLIRFDARGSAVLHRSSLEERRPSPSF